jgi:hypothetical protein
MPVSTLFPSLFFWAEAFRKKMLNLVETLVIVSPYKKINLKIKVKSIVRHCAQLGGFRTA